MSTARNGWRRSTAVALAALWIGTAWGFATAATASTELPNPDSTDTVSPQSVQTIAQFVFLALILLNIPLILRAIKLNRPLSANSDATRFKGKYRRWRLTHVTGRVLAASHYTDTYGGGVSGGDTVSGTSWVTTDVHETMRLRLADGRQTDAGVVNFDVSARPGDALSVWYARKGSKSFPIAVLNHTTNQQSTTLKSVFRLQEPHQLFLVFYVVFFLLFVDGFFSLRLVGVPIVLFFLLLIAYVIGSRWVPRWFDRHGIRPMWHVGNAEAQSLVVGG